MIARVEDWWDGEADYLKVSDCGLQCCLAEAPSASSASTLNKVSVAF